MNIDLTLFIEALLTLVMVVITSVVVPYIKKKTDAQQQKEINAWVSIAVSAAEQIFTGSGRGKEKKEYVIDWLEARNIVFDYDLIDAMIEAAVYELKSGIIVVEGEADENK